MAFYASVISGSSTGTTVDGLTITGSVTLNDDLTLGGGDGALTFTGTGSVKLPDNNAAGLVFEQANNAYLTFKTYSDNTITIPMSRVLKIKRKDKDEQ